MSDWWISQKKKNDKWMSELLICDWWSSICKIYVVNRLLFLTSLKSQNNYQGQNLSKTFIVACFN